MIAIEISCNPLTNKNNYKPFPFAIRKIRITKKDRKVEVAEVNRNNLGALDYYSLKTGKPVDFKKILSYSLSPLPLTIYKLNGTPRQTAKCKLKDILLQDLEDHNNEGLQSLQEYAILLDITALMNTILTKSSTYAKFDKLFVKGIPNVYGRVDIIADCYKIKSIKSSEQPSIRRGQLEKIHIALFLSKIPVILTMASWETLILKKRFFELIFEYIER